MFVWNFSFSKAEKKKMSEKKRCSQQNEKPFHFGSHFDFSFLLLFSFADASFLFLSLSFVFHCWFRFFASLFFLLFRCCLPFRTVVGDSFTVTSARLKYIQLLHSFRPTKGLFIAWFALSSAVAFFNLLLFFLSPIALAVALSIRFCVCFFFSIGRVFKRNRFTNEQRCQSKFPFIENNETSREYNLHKLSERRTRKTRKNIYKKY